MHNMLQSNSNLFGGFLLIYIRNRGLFADCVLDREGAVAGGFAGLRVTRGVVPFWRAGLQRLSPTAVSGARFQNSLSGFNCSIR